MKYINYKTEQGLETVDEAETMKEARYLVQEYNMAFGGGCYISSRCTNDWRDR
tara:strand:+ start:1638 stop:1796 length:159 start_codon:yes stop_codon:yes gene_type:complete